MQIRIASHEDLAFIEGAYEHARAFMQANGNATQWPEGYPGRIDAEEDIARGHCFVVTDEAGLLAVFSFAPGPDETYAQIDGAWHSDADYHVIHRVAAVRGRGVARAIFTFALSARITCAATPTRTMSRCGVRLSPSDSKSAARSPWPTVRSASPTTGSKRHHATPPRGHNTLLSDTPCTFACKSLLTQNNGRSETA